jgi:glucokinase
MTALIADLGGTNIRFAIVKDGGIFQEQSFRCKDYGGLTDAAVSYMQKAGEKPDHGAFGVAAAVDGDQVELINNPAWNFSTEETRQKLGFSSLKVINDFEAIAWGVPVLGPNDYRQVGGGTPREGQRIGVIGPGTGLGVASIVFTGNGNYQPVAGEGGHVTVPGTSIYEDRLLGVLREQFGQVEAEQVISGPGLVNLFNAINRLEARNLPEKCAYQAEQIGKAAVDGTCHLSRKALNTMCQMLGTVAGDLALTLGAKGGIYIAGGIVPKLGDYFDQSGFRESFNSKGRVRGYVTAIPTYVVTHPNPGLVGLAKVAGMAAP